MPSASVLAVQREQSKSRAAPTAGIAVIADPVFDLTDARLEKSRLAASRPSTDVNDFSRILKHIGSPVIPRLPFTRNEADAILAVAKGQKNFRAVDFAATKEAVLGGALKNYRIVHFATHGFLDTERPTLSSIVLSLVDRNGNARDGFLRAQEIYNMELNADLVVLSACQTGLGKSIEGEGLIGLTRGLMYAGAQRVVVSLWNVSDRATATLMSRFYRDMLANGKTPSAALRAAQLEVMKIKGWENPYYWAPFVMQGDWR
jgi:CHAT domain-containing protein